MASSYAITLEQGTTFYQKIEYRNADGTPMDTMGFSAKMQIRSKVGGIIKQELSTDTGGITLSGTGLIELRLTPVQTRNIGTGGVYDLELTKPNGEVKRLIQGSVYSTPEVTI